MIKPLPTNHIAEGESTTATIALRNDSVVDGKNPLNVSIKSNESSILKVSLDKCTLKSKDDTCVIS